MRTKTLLLTAALSAAGVAASMAQVYSVNVVGYVNVTVPKGTLKVLASPLMNGDNKLNTIMPQPDTADGAALYMYNKDTKGWDIVSFFAGFGWFSPNDPVVTPGTAFFVQAPAAADLNITFVGEVMQTGQYTLSVPVKGNGELALVGSQVPMETRVGFVGTTTQNTMEFPGADGDTIFLWNQTSGAYDIYSFFGGYGWFNANDTSADGPVIPVGTGFWIQKGPGTPDVNWTRNFNVQ